MSNNHIIIESKQNCCGCEVCANACPNDCIRFETDSEGFHYPVVDESRCINCGKCIKVCQLTGLNKVGRIVFNREFYAAVNNNREKRMQESSGGVFSVLSEKILQSGGIVYGVAMNDNCYGCSFLRADNSGLLERLYGSKYIQARANDVYIRVKEDLISGKSVLFSGTPCQVNGLKCFLGREFPNLYTIDCICHGVPSPKIWRKNIQCIERKRGKKVTSVNFRSKKRGWNSFSILVYSGTDKLYDAVFRMDPYMRLMLEDIDLRPSCYYCASKDDRRLSDLTLGDFWGCEEYYPEMNENDNGTSAVIINSEKGKTLLKCVEDKLKICKIEYSQMAAKNHCYYESVSIPAARESFFSDVNTLSFTELQKKYVHISKKRRIKDLLRRTTEIFRTIE